jgi:hypothetical protein
LAFRGFPNLCGGGKINARQFAQPFHAPDLRYLDYQGNAGACLVALILFTITV